MREVLERLGLDPRRLGEVGATVTDLHREQPRQAVEQPVAGGVPEVATLARAR